MTWDKFWLGLMAAVVVVGLLFAGTAIVCSVRANGETDYCYIEWYSPTDLPPFVRLMAHVPWRNDRRIAYFRTPEEASEQAVKMKCPLEHH